MEAARFIVTYFASKHISLLTAFVCWPPGNSQSGSSSLVARSHWESLELWRQAHGYGMKLRVHTDLLRLPTLQAYDVHREGVVLDMSCPLAAAVIEQASSARAFNLRHSWLLLHDSQYNTSTLGDAAILPDADVVLSTPDTVLDIYRIRIDRPLVGFELNAGRASSVEDFTALWGRLPSTVTRRKNLDNIYIPSVILISQPEHFRGWSDLSNRQIDTFPKLTYPLLMDCAYDLNFRYDMKQVSVYGEEHNGTFDGLVGELERGAEIGASSIFMRADRWRVLHYCAETVTLTGAFIFRQPSQSSVSNVFVLPFSRGVWAASGALLALSGALLTALARRPQRADQTLTTMDAFTFAIGALCQQGFPVTPHVSSIRMVMFCTLLASVFVFTAYSAKIVAILQTPSDAIQTIDDLTNSPLALGVQETTYKRVYFAESREPATRRLYRRKLQPLGERAYLSVVDGIARVRTGLFAFQVEVGAGYDVISKTFTEPEKCGLKEIQAFRLPMVGVPVRRHSGYRELLAVRLRWQREVGLMSRARRTWLAERARCAGGAAGVRGVPLGDVLPAMQVVCGGALGAALLLVAELAVHTHTQYKQTTHY